MTRIACAGHRKLTIETEQMVSAAIRDYLCDRVPNLIGLSFLADGADQIFAKAVLTAGGQLEVIVPAKRYRDGLPPSAHAEYDALLARAVRVHRLPFIDSTADAHMRASEHMLIIADELLAIWDGKPARGHGGTADVVAAARHRHMPIHVIWPSNAARAD